MFGFTFAAVFSSQNLFGPSWLILGDLILLTLVPVVLFKSASLRPGLSTSQILALGLFISAYLISVIANASRTGFDVVEGSRSLLKLILYVFSFVLYSSVFNSAADSAIAAAMRWLIRLSLFFAALQQLSSLANIRLPFVRDISVVFERAGSPFPRSSGLMSEPSTFGILLVVAGFVLARRGRLRRLDLALISVGLILSGSMAAIAAAVLALILIVGPNAGKIGRQWRRGALLTLAGVALATAMIPPIRSSVDTRIIQRVDQLIAGQDASGQGRLVDSWRAGLAAFEDSPVVGYGPGNQSQGIADSGVKVDARIIDAGGGWNILANSVVVAGLLGLTSLLFLLFTLFRHDLRGFFFIMLLCFATGTILGWTWWFLLVTIPVRSSSSGQAIDDGIITPSSSQAAPPSTIRSLAEPNPAS